MTNYKIRPHTTTPIYEDLDEIPCTSGTTDTFGSWVEFSGDIGIDKALYFVATHTAQGHTTGKGGVIEIAEGASSSEVVKQRINLPNSSALVDMCIPAYYPFTNNARIAVRVKDGESTNNEWSINLMIGPIQ